MHMEWVNKRLIFVQVIDITIGTYLAGIHHLKRRFSDKLHFLVSYISFHIKTLASRVYQDSYC
jgi:hypothetical protein